MSSSMETAMLLSETESKRTTWKDIDLTKWESKADMCPAQSAEKHCFISDEPCTYGGCFGRYWGNN